MGTRVISQYKDSYVGKLGPGSSPTQHACGLALVGKLWLLRNVVLNISEKTPLFMKN